ncbi:hypothetical protein FOL47_001239 [Perkinsus chesapeaki]|uniref:RRM domain-containing protein n=1 Tax=Perkinsus chesapeaki TaxID=330153 RepID=A0A7J6ML68_PERCH|nr:hypothetical protein FOL47_001239 [Perkinsus chesapeaki]
MSISSSGSGSKDPFNRGVGPHSSTDDGGDGMGPLAGMATMKNTFLEFGTPAHETSFRQRSKTLPVVPNMQELLQGSLVKGALESGTHCAAFNEEDEGMSDDDDDDDDFMIRPDRTQSNASMSHGPDAAALIGSKAPPPRTIGSTSPTIDQLIAMQLLATLQTQQLQQGYSGAQFGLGCSNHFCRRGRHSSGGAGCCVDSDDDDFSAASEASSSHEGIGGKEYTLVDLDKEITISPRGHRRGYGQQAPLVVTPSRIKSGAGGDTSAAAAVDDDVNKTTVMLRNIPNKYTQKILLNAIDGRGFEGTYDFFYLPIDFRNRCNLGYAFLNFTSHESAVAFTRSFNGYSLPAFKSTKVCEVCWARVQGLEANVDHYRNSPVNEMPHNEYKPMLFVEGHPVEFPRPLSEGGDQRPPLVVHQTPQHTGGGILQPPPPKHIQHDGTAGGSAGSSASSMIRKNKIFIGGLSVTSTSEAIRQHFMQWGRVTEAAVITDKKTGQSRGFGFCTYAHDVPDEVLTAEHWVDGRNIGVRIYASGPPAASSSSSQSTGGPSSRVHPDFGFVHAPPPPHSSTISSSSSSASTRDYLTLLSKHHQHHHRGRQQQLVSPH